MRLRQILRASLPATLLVLFMLAPRLDAAKPHSVKHKVVNKPRLHAVPARHFSHAVVRHRITHKVPSRRVKHSRARSSRYSRFRYRMPAGPSSDRIEQIQQALARTGFYQGDPSGMWDSDTITAMKNFQQAHDLTPTGKIDAASLQQLGLGSAVAGLAPPRPLVAADNSGPSEQ